jgi:hypothetical protein
MLIDELDRVPESYFKKLKSANGIWEVRATQGNGTYRLLGFRILDLELKLLHPVFVFQIPIDHASCRGVIRWRRIHAGLC